MKLWLQGLIGYHSPELDIYKKHRNIISQLRKLPVPAYSWRTGEVYPDIGLMILDIYTLSWFLKDTLGFIEDSTLAQGLLELIIQASSNDRQLQLKKQLERSFIKKLSATNSPGYIKKYLEQQLQLYAGSFEERQRVRHNRIYNKMFDLGRLLSYDLLGVVKLFSPAIDEDEPPTDQYELGAVPAQYLNIPFQELAEHLSGLDLDDQIYEGIMLIARLNNQNPPTIDIFERAMAAIKELQTNNYLQIIAAITSNNPFFNPIGINSTASVTDKYFQRLEIEVWESFNYFFPSYN